MLETQRLEKVLVDDVGAGADDGVDHVVADHVDENLLQPRADERPGEAEDHAAFAVAKHAVVNVGGAMKVARAVRHVLHGIDDRDNVVTRDVKMLDGLAEQLFLGGPIDGRRLSVGIRHDAPPVVVEKRFRQPNARCNAALFPRPAYTTQRATSARYGVPTVRDPPLRAGVALSSFLRVCHASQAATNGSGKFLGRGSVERRHD